MKFWSFLFRKSSSIHSYCVGREPDNCLNDMNVIALERIRLGASFEPYTGTIRCVLTFLRWIKMILYRVFFLKKLVYTHIFMIFFSKQVFTNGRVETSIIVQMIWIWMRSKKEILALLLSHTVDSQVVWALFCTCLK